MFAKVWHREAFGIVFSFTTHSLTTLFHVVKQIAPQLGRLKPASREVSHPLFAVASCVDVSCLALGSPEALLEDSPGIPAWQRPAEEATGERFCIGGTAGILAKGLGGPGTSWNGLVIGLIASHSFFWVLEWQGHVFEVAVMFSWFSAVMICRP